MKMLIFPRTWVMYQFHHYIKKVLILCSTINKIWLQTLQKTICTYFWTLLQPHISWAKYKLIYSVKCCFVSTCNIINLSFHSSLPTGWHAPRGRACFGFPHLPCKKQYKYYNTITVHLQFLQILQTFFKLHRKMFNIQKYDLDEIS
jgi:hypothetical protein